MNSELEFRWRVGCALVGAAVGLATAMSLTNGRAEWARVYRPAEMTRILQIRLAGVIAGAIVGFFGGGGIKY